MCSYSLLGKGVLFFFSTGSIFFWGGWDGGGGVLYHAVWCTSEMGMKAIK